MTRVTTSGDSRYPEGWPPVHLTSAARALEKILHELHPGQHFIVEVRDEDDEAERPEAGRRRAAVGDGTVMNGSDKGAEPRQVNPIEEAKLMSLSDYFRSQADWRRQKAEQYPEDERNAQSAEALESLADYVEGDEPSSQLIAGLGEHLLEGVTLGGEETQREVARYGFGHRVTALHHAEFLDELTTLCLVDAYEFAREHGDDPTGTLFGFEVDAAREDVMLPRRYFELRTRTHEHQLETAVASYRGENES